MTNYAFLPFLACAKFSKTPSETLYTALRKNHFPEVNDYQERNWADMRRYGVERMSDHTKRSLAMSGLYVLRDENKSIISVAVLKDNTIKRIVTMPKYRHKGYASLLIRHITEQMERFRCPSMWSPVDPAVVPLFQRLGWVQVGRHAPDGCLDWCPPWAVAHYPTANQQVRWEIDEWIDYLLSLMPRATPTP